MTGNAQAFTHTLTADHFLAVDLHGRELLRFRLRIGGRNVEIRPPVVSQWRAFLEQAYVTFSLMSTDADSLLALHSAAVQVPDWTGQDPEYASAWIRLTTLALERQPAICDSIIEMLMHLRPRVRGLPAWCWLVRRWLNRHATLPDVAMAFAACTAYREWQKKTTEWTLHTIFPSSARQASGPGSQNEQGPALPTSVTGRASGINISWTHSEEMSASDQNG